MQIAIGAKIKSGPYGGGNQFASNLTEYLIQHGINVVFDLNSDNIDIILLIEPRTDLAFSAFRAIDVIKYLIYNNKKTIVVHRINECDERKNTKMVNKLLLLANRCADHTVFISNWLLQLYKTQGYHSNNYSVILNGGDTKIFNSKNHIKWNKAEKIKIVTHHWSGNWLKGFDVYKELDNLLGEKAYKDKISFTYIGRLPSGFKFNNSLYRQPLSGYELAKCLNQQHIYLTASQNEPAGMHHIEGALCGLPLLYRNSGALPEYCNEYGVMFDLNNFQEKLLEIIANYDFWVDRIKNYPYSADKMCRLYYKLFIELHNQREKLISRRNWGQLDRYGIIMKTSGYKFLYRLINYYRKT